MIDIVEVKEQVKSGFLQAYVKNDVIYLANEIGEVVKIGDVVREKVKYKVGDKVITTRRFDFEGTELFPIGTVGVITLISDDSRLPYRISALNDYWWYSDDMFELYEENNDE